ncbi:MAG: transglutaminase-like domain-containing protein, partial [Planctomycetes bacterium]|nr:transglutaminase-like domain-containing protein [Planctomycetota bacterium]
IPENDFDPYNFKFEDDYEEYPSAFDEDEVKNQRTKAPEETSEVNPRYSFLSSLLNKQPRFYVNFSKLGQVGKRFKFDDFYTKVKVFDVYDNERWISSKQNKIAWSEGKKTEYVFPLMYEILEGSNNTRGGILSNVVFSSDFDSNKITAQYQLFPEQHYPMLFTPDFPLRVHLNSFNVNADTGELLSNTLSQQLQYSIDSFHFDYDKLKALVCTRGKGKAEKHWLGVGKFDADLYELAMQIIEESKINPEFTEFIADKYSDIDIIRAVIRFLKNSCAPYKFTYEIAPPKVPAHENPLKFFLFKSRIGNCTLFNTAAAVLLRYLGIPTRIVVGYRGGKWLEEEFRYEVQYLRAHLWFEVYFKDFGWYRFDATPDWERDQKISQVENDIYELPKYYNNFDESAKDDAVDNNDNNEPDRIDELFSDTENMLMQDEKDDKDKGEIFGKFLTEYDNDEMLSKFASFVKFLLGSGFRSLLLVIMILLIPAILYRSWISRKFLMLLGIFNNGNSDSGVRDSRKSRKSRIIENRLISDFRDLERLFRKFGYSRSPSETWIEFNKRIDGFSALISTMLNSLVLSYYYARFGMKYNEFKDFKTKLGNLKKHLQKQLHTKE